jgi:hypothetical protein
VVQRNCVPHSLVYVCTATPVACCASFVPPLMDLRAAPSQHSAAFFQLTQSTRAVLTHADSLKSLVQRAALVPTAPHHHPQTTIQPPIPPRGARPAYNALRRRNDSGLRSVLLRVAVRVALLPSSQWTPAAASGNVQTHMTGCSIDGRGMEGWFRALAIYLVCTCYNGVQRVRGSERAAPLPRRPQTVHRLPAGS